MNDYLYVLIFSLLGGVVSLMGGALLISKASIASKLAWYATPFAAGGLLAAVFLDLLKEGLEVSSADTVLMSVLFGILAFFMAERFLHWFHHHHGDHESHKDASTSLIIIGDTVHNALDGIAIAAAFLISVPTGIVTTFAVAAHEIPQEIGDFGLLLSKGMSRRRVLLANALSALATTVTALITYSLGSDEKLPVGVLLGISSGFLLYVALSDIIPTIHQKADSSKLFNIQPLLLLAGVFMVGLSVNLAHQYIDTGHDESERTHTNELSDCEKKQQLGYKIGCIEDETRTDH